MKRLLRSCALVLVFASPGRGQDPQDELRRAYEQSQAAHRDKDHKTFLEASRKVAQLAPRSSRALYNLASAHALVGQKAEAVAVLERLAAMGLAFDPASDEDFAAIKEAPEFQAVMRRMADLRVPVVTSAVAFRLPQADAIEGIAHDPKTGAFFVSSIRHRKIVRVSADGSAKDFTAEGQDGLYSVIALGVDPARRSLWATSSATDWMKDARKEEKGRSWLLEYDIDTGKMRRRLGPPAAAPNGQLSDLVVGPNGDVTVADPETGRLYRLAPGAEALGVILEPGRLTSPQGMAWSADGRFLFIADYLAGIARLDPRTNAVTILDAPAEAFVNGIDGLVLAGDSLVGIQNGARPHRIVRLRLDPSAERVVALSVLERANPSWDEPTLAAVVGKDVYYVGTSEYGRFGEGPVDDAKLEPPSIFRMPIDW